MTSRRLEWRRQNQLGRLIEKGALNMSRTIASVSTKHNSMGMFDGTSLPAVWFCSAANAAHAAFTGLF